MTVTTLSGAINHGIVLGHSGYGYTLTVSKTGRIVASKYAIITPDFQIADSITNAGTLHANTFGIIVSVYANIANTGAIYGTDAGIFLSTGSIVNAGTISGKIAGLYASGDAEGLNGLAIITNTANGDITGTDAGIVLNANSYQTVILNNAGNIYGKTYGAYVYRGTIVNNGLINSSTYGIALASGVVTNFGTITGKDDGISLGTLAATIINDSTISGGSFAIYGRDSFALNISPRAKFIGRVIDKSANGELNLQGTNAATITGIGTSFQGFSTLAFGAGASWTVEGDLAGLATSQTIAGFTVGDTIILDGFSAVSESISSAGLIVSNGAATETLHIAHANFVQNLSLSSANDKSTIAFSPITSISTINAFTPAQITPGYGYFSNDLIITNTGTAPDLHGGLGSAGISIDNFGDLTDGVTLSGNYYHPATFINYGLINGSQPVIALSVVSLSNQGTILTAGSNHTGVYLQGSNFTNSGTIYANGQAVMSGGSDIVNTGNISGSVTDSLGTITNIGDISANTTVAATAYDVFNSGTISGQSIGVSLGILLQNSGVISGGSIGISGFGKIINSGTIEGGRYAIYNPGGVDYINLALYPGAKFIGGVKDPSQHGTLSFMGSSAASIDLGLSFLGFSQIDFSSGSTWSVEGTSLSLADGQTIENFIAGETLILDSFTATTESFVPGTGLVLSNATSTQTLEILGNFSTQNFDVTTSGGSTTITSTIPTLTPISTINSAFHREITLGSPNYASSISITNAGVVLVPSGPAIYGPLSIRYQSVVNSGSVGAVNLGISGTIVNYGIIQGLNPTSIFGGTIFNAGLIEGTDSTRSDTGASDIYGEIINTGTITSVNVGIGLVGGTIINTGLVAGALNATSMEFGTIINSGTFIGTVFSQIYLHLNVNPGAQFDGPIISDDTLLKLGGTNSGSLDIGTSFTGLKSIEFEVGSTWSLEGSSFDLASGQVIEYFTSTDTLTLDNFVSTSDSFEPGIGLVLSNNTIRDTLQLLGNFSLSNFVISNVNDVTQIHLNNNTIQPFSTISFLIPREVKLGSINYSSNITITNSGAVLPTYSAAIYSNGTNSNSGITNYGSVGSIYIDNGTILNYGTIRAQQQEGQYVIALRAGTIENAGLISGNLALWAIRGSASDIIVNSGTIDDVIEGILVSGGTVINTGLISADANGVRINGQGELLNGGTIIGGIYLGLGSTLMAESNAQFSGPAVSKLGTLALAGTTAGSLDIGTSFTGFSNIEFTAGATWSLEAGSIAIAAGQTISGFTFGDTIIIDNFVVNTLDTTYVSGTGLELTDTLGNHLTLDIAGNFSTASFIVIDPPGDTTIEAVCYLRGTRIATPAGDMPIESLRIGDTVITRFNGYRKIKWIGRQIFAPRFIAKNPDQIPVRITAGALARNIPMRDLFISPGHSMLIGQNLILAKNLVNGVTVTQPAPSEDVHYYQLEFETHDCVLAEGAWSESYADTPDLRGQFHNAGDFWHRFPDHAAPVEQILCAPRPLEGPGLEAALRPLTASAAARISPGRLHGFIDAVTDHNIEGWAWDESNQHLPVLLEILVNNHRLGTALACQPRTDLKAAGYGQGNCGFMFASPLGLPVESAQIQIRRVSDGATLNHLNRRAA